MSSALIYLTPGLPVRIENADRLVYLPDGSQHVLDAHDRPLFTAPPKTGVCIVMEYSADEPKLSQVASFAKKEHAEKVEQTRREELAADATQQFPQVQQQGPSPDMVNVNPSTGHVAPIRPIVPVQVSPLQQQQSPFPRVADFSPRTVMQPGEVRVQPSAEAPNDVTGEMVVPDFPEAPKGAIQESEGSSSPQSPKHEETPRTPEHGREAS